MCQRSVSHVHEGNTLNRATEQPVLLHHTRYLIINNYGIHPFCYKIQITFSLLSFITSYSYFVGECNTAKYLMQLVYCYYLHQNLLDKKVCMSVSF